MSAVDASVGAETRTRRPVHPAIALAIGVAGAVLGLAPWLMAGARLPVQNLWASDVTHVQMPIALLPFSNYFAVETSALLVIGAAITGAAVVALGGLGREANTPVALLGVLVLLGIASRKAVPVTLSVAAAAVALTPWLASLAYGMACCTEIVPAIVGYLVTWLPPIVAGVAIGWCGVRTMGRAVTAVASVGIIWAGPAFVTAFSYGLGTRIYLQNPQELVPAMRQVFSMSLGSAGQGPQRVAIAVAVAIVTWFGLWARDRTRVSRDPAPGRDYSASSL